jgi:hypothetical protein
MGNIPIPGVGDVRSIWQMVENVITILQTVNNLRTAVQQIWDLIEGGATDSEMLESLVASMAIIRNDLDQAQTGSFKQVLYYRTDQILTAVNALESGGGGGGGGGDLSTVVATSLTTGGNVTAAQALAAAYRWCEQNILYGVIPYVGNQQFGLAPFPLGTRLGQDINALNGVDVYSRPAGQSVHAFLEATLSQWTWYDLGVYSAALVPAVPAGNSTVIWCLVRDAVAASTGDGGADYSAELAAIAATQGTHTGQLVTLLGRTIQTAEADEAILAGEMALPEDILTRIRHYTPLFGELIADAGVGITQTGAADLGARTAGLWLSVTGMPPTLTRFPGHTDNYVRLGWIAFGHGGAWQPAVTIEWADMWIPVPPGATEYQWRLLPGLVGTLWQVAEPELS